MFTVIMQNNPIHEMILTKVNIKRLIKHLKELISSAPALL